MAERCADGSFAESGELDRGDFLWEFIGDVTEAVVDFEDLIKIVGDGVVDDIEGFVGGELLADDSEVVIKFVSDERNIAIAKDEMGDAANDDDAEKGTNWEEGGNAGIGVAREKIVPFVEDVAEAVGDEDGHG